MLVFKNKLFFFLLFPCVVSIQIKPNVVDYVLARFKYYSLFRVYLDFVLFRILSYNLVLFFFKESFCELFYYIKHVWTSLGQKKVTYLYGDDAWRKCLICNGISISFRKIFEINFHSFFWNTYIVSLSLVAQKKYKIRN